jgi:hypothetical protein
MKMTLCGVVVCVLTDQCRMKLSALQFPMYCRQVIMICAADMPVLEDNVDVVADPLMVNLPQNQGSLHVHEFMLQSAASC